MLQNRRKKTEGQFSFRAQLALDFCIDAKFCIEKHKTEHIKLHINPFEQDKWLK